MTIGPFTVTPHPAEHPVEAYALRVEGPAEDDPSRRVVLTYSGDTDACEGLQTAAAGADLLLAEAAFQEGRDTTRGIHLTGRRAGEAARDAAVARLVLTHLPPVERPRGRPGPGARGLGRPAGAGRAGPADRALTVVASVTA